MAGRAVRWLTWAVVPLAFSSALVCTWRLDCPVKSERTGRLFPG